MLDIKGMHMLRSKSDLREDLGPEYVEDILSRSLKIQEDPLIRETDTIKTCETLQTFDSGMITFTKAPFGTW